MPGKKTGWGKGHKSSSRIGRRYKRKGYLQKGIDDDVGKANDENEISWEVPEELESIVDETVADLQIEVVCAIYIMPVLCMYIAHLFI